MIYYSTITEIISKAITLPAGAVAKYCDKYVWLCVCLAVCLFVRENIFATTRAIFTKYFAHAAHVHGSVLLRHVDDRPHRLSIGWKGWRECPAWAKCNLRLPCLLWSPCVIGQTIIFLPCDFYLCFFVLSFFLFSSPNLSGRRLDVYHTSTHGVALVRI